MRLRPLRTGSITPAAQWRAQEARGDNPLQPHQGRGGKERGAIGAGQRIDAEVVRPRRAGWLDRRANPRLRTRSGLGEPAGAAALAAVLPERDPRRTAANGVGRGKGTERDPLSLD